MIGRSYGGEIALDLARRFPDRVKALALLEPAMLTLDPEGEDWLDSLRQRAMQAGAIDVSSVAKVFLQDVVGDEVWESFPKELKDMFIGNGPAILAELRGRSLELSAQELAEIDQPTLMVSAKDSPETFRRVDDIVAEALPNCAKVLVDGGHFINPANPAVLDFVDHQVAPQILRPRVRESGQLKLAHRSAMSATLKAAQTTPTNCCLTIRSSRTTRARATVAAGYSEVMTATRDRRPVRVARRKRRSAPRLVTPSKIMLPPIPRGDGPEPVQSRPAMRRKRSLKRASRRGATGQTRRVFAPGG